MPPYEPVKPTSNSTFSTKNEIKIGGMIIMRGNSILIYNDSLDKLLALLDKVSFSKSDFKLFVKVVASIG